MTEKAQQTDVVGARFVRTELVEVGRERDGSPVWGYTDPEQALFASDIWHLTGWQVAGLDQWLGDDAAWSGRDDVRAVLARLRAEFFERWRQGASDEILSLYARLMHSEALRAGMHAQGRTALVKVQAHSAEQSKRRKGHTALPAEVESRIFRQYEQRLREGTAYGFFKETAARHNVAQNTIHNIVRRYQKNSIAQ